MQSTAEPHVVLIDAGGANLGSVRYALQRLGIDPEVTADPNAVARADRIILPGVGAAANAMRCLRDAGLIELMRQPPAPLLGICLGMQLLFEASEEGDVECLGLLPGRVQRMPSTAGLRVPHMGWNALQIRKPSSLLQGVDDGAACYFVHGYAMAPSAVCTATSTHGMCFAATVQHGQVAGTQFHPERSGPVGARILRNFIDYGLTEVARP